MMGAEAITGAHFQSGTSGVPLRRPLGLFPAFSPEEKKNKKCSLSLSGREKVPFWLEIGTTRTGAKAI